MAWTDTTAYTVDEKAKVKADLDEVSNLIQTSVTKINAVSGKFTDEEQALLNIKQLVDARSVALA